MKIFKFSLNNSIIRRIGREEQDDTFESLLTIVETLFPEIETFDALTISWVDDEGDEIILSSDPEVQESYSVMSTQGNGYLKYNLTLSSPPPRATDTFRCQQCQVESPYPHFQCVLYPHIKICDLCEKKLAPLSVNMLKVYDSSQVVFRSQSQGLGVPDEQNQCNPSNIATNKFTGKCTFSDPNSDMMNSSESVLSSLTASSTCSGKGPKPMAKFIRHVTFPDSCHVPAGSSFVKTWQVRNDGPESWPEGCALVNAGGDQLFPGSSEGVRISVPAASAGSDIEVSIELVAPSTVGRYQSYFRLQTGEGRRFGQRLWADVRVMMGDHSGGDVASAEECPEGGEELLITPTLADSDTNDDNIPSIGSQPNSKWAHELDVLGGMGFTETETLVPLLERHSVVDQQSGGAAPTQEEVLRMTVMALLAV